MISMAVFLLARRLWRAAFLAVLLCAPTVAWAQDAVARAQVLYNAARYEEVLAVLEHADTSDRSPYTFDVMRYRALCWLALGQEREAERAIAALVDLDPFYAPDARDVSPRVAQAFTEVRQSRLPGVARTMLVEARRALRRRDSNEADRLLRFATQLLAEPALATRPELADLRLAADALAELGRLQLESASLVTARPLPRAEAPESDASPFPLAQSFPAWAPLESSVARTEFEGAVRVSVDAQGTVVAAAIERPTHPPYDRLVLEAARDWRYRPARRDGVHVAADLVVEYSLRPPVRWQIFRSVRAAQ
jgi:TonB family protein